MKQQNDFDDEVPSADELSGDALAVDGLLRELGCGPADPSEVDESFVQRIVAAIESETHAKAETSHLPAAKSSSRARVIVQSHSNSARGRKSKTVSRRKKPVRPIPWAIWLPVAACISLVAGLYLFKAEPVAPIATLLEFGGSCIISADGKEVSASTGAGIRNNDMLRVPQNGWAVVKYADGTRVMAQSGSVLTFHAGSSDISKKVAINEGTLVADVSKQNAGQSMVIITPDLESRILGTRLIVSVAKKTAGPKAARSRVDVEEGRVRVTQLSDKASVEVAEGQYAVVAPGEKFSVRHTTVELGKSLAGHWKFDEGSGTNFGDASGQGNFGRLHGATWTQGHVGGALSFAGHEYVEICNASALNSTNDFSVCAWIKLSALNRNQSIAGSQDGSGNGYMLAVSENNQVELEIRDAKSNSQNSDAGIPLKNGNWYHVAGIYSFSDKTVKIYINGELDRTISAERAPRPVGGPFSIGAESFGHRANKFHGQIDDVRFYKRALNDSELRKLASSLVH